MDQREVFCEECRDDVNFTIKEEVITATLKGKQYEYFGKNGYCNNCGNRLYVPELINYNLDELYAVYQDTKNAAL